MSASATAGRRRALELAFAMALAVGLLGAVPVSRADEHWDRDRAYRQHEFREHEFREREFLDSRYHHDHYYPPVGFAFGALPVGHVVLRYQGATFFFGGGVWYSAAGPGRFVVVAPPVGVVVPLLPPFYATVWVGGVPYYYANNAYYVRGPQGYVVVNPPPPAAIVEQPPANAVVQQPPSSTAYRTPLAQLSMYPNHGQSQQQQAKDRYECHRWGVEQSGYDPSRSDGPGGTEQQMDGYRAAMKACLDARDYTVW
ncbi:MAG TPA: DUF6515 family protein [Burkholderiales bacterium]|nr:DUF6515 family protein [Burkholderiales bacterium]